MNKVVSRLSKLLIIPIIFLIVSCGQTNDTKENTEYYDMKEYTGLKSEESRFKKEDISTVLKKIEDREPGVYYIGYEGCPWCQSLVPVLNDVLKKNDTFAYYVDVRSDEFTSDGSLANKLDSIDKGLKNYSSGGYVPFVIVVKKDGSVKTHVGTLKEHNATESDLTSEQREKLVKRLEDIIK